MTILISIIYLAFISLGLPDSYLICNLPYLFFLFFNLFSYVITNTYPQHISSPL